MPSCPSCGADMSEGLAFCGRCGALLNAARAGQGDERKVVTVLFCDLVDFTASSDGADPEDVIARLRLYHAHLRREIERLGGTVEKFIGDAVMAVFGAPIAHEDDPERAVRAALRILQAIQHLNTTHAALALAVRVGICTGGAVVALGARPQAGEGMVAGDVVNTAARLQGVAPVGGIVVGEATWRATREAFDYQPLRAVLVKGKAAPLRIWQVQAARSRLNANAGAAPTPFVGRDTELASLQGVYGRMIAEVSAQLVTIVGEPGVGKSRLVQEFRAFIDGQPDRVAWRQGRCPAYGDGVTFWALGEVVKAHAGILESDDPVEAADKLGAAVAAVVPEQADRVWLEHRLAPLAGLPNAENTGTAERDEAFAAWCRFLQAVAAQQPLLVVLEDLHWADPAMLDFVHYLVERASRSRLLVVGTARPELYDRTPNWGRAVNTTTTIQLSPLSDADTARLVTALLGHAVLPTETHAVLLERAGGNPLYAEQVCRMLIDRGMLQRDQRTARLVPGADVVFPESIQALITARLDALSPGQKTLLQDAAVVGKVFQADALAVTGRRDAATIQDGLQHLAWRGFIRPVRGSSVRGEADYAFWHVLTRDVAYAQLPRAARMRKHRAAAAWIERTAGERVADHAEVLAHHYATALALARATGATEDAISLQELAARFQVLAGDRAMGLDVARADAYYQRALQHYPPSDPRRARGPGQAKAHASADNIVSPAPARTLHHPGKASDRWEGIPPDPTAVAGVDRADLLLRAAEAASQSGDFRRAVSLAREAVDTIDATAEPTRAAHAHERLGQFLIDASPMRTGLEEILGVCRRAVELAPRDPPTRLRARVTIGLADALIFARRFQEARGWCHEALAVARAIGSGEDEDRVLMELAMLEYSHHGDADTARALLRDARARAVATASRSEELRAVFALGDIEFAVGRLTTACATFDDGIKLAEQSGLARSPYGVETRTLACIAHYTAGDWDRAARLAALIDDRSPIAGGLSAVALYVDVGRARLIPLERLEWLAALGNDDPWIAYHTGGCTADLACWQGDLDRARTLVRSTLARVDELGEWGMLSAIWPAAVGLAAEADRAARARGAGDQPGLAEARALGHELRDRARASVQRTRAIPRRVGREALAWLAKAEAEWTRLEGHSDPERWRAAVDAFAYGYRYEVARCQWRLAEALLGVGDRTQATATARAAYQTAVQLRSEPLRQAIEALAQRGRLDLDDAPTERTLAGP
jgi:class 3 adenylate cyclase/tetratricopeptide (TPR) repeat protein